MIKNNNKEQGSITIVVFATVLFILLILATTFTTMTYKRKSQAVELEDLKDIYSMEGEEKIQSVYQEVSHNKGLLDGLGTEDDPYKIYTIEDLVRFSNRSNSGENFQGKNIELMTTLDFNEDFSYEKPNRTDYGDINENGQIEPLKTELTTGKGFMPIGKNTLFVGTFDGKNNSIINLHIDRNISNCGFFGNTYIVRNLTVKNGYIRGGSATGGVVGSLRTGKIENCHNDNTTVILAEGTSMYVGGIAGQIVSDSIGIDNCSNSGNISAYGTYTYNGSVMQVCGGVVGLASNNTRVTNCSNYGTVTGYNNGQAAGGIVGSSNPSVTISNCYNGNTITGSTKVGGIIGNINSLTISNCYNKGEIISTDNKKGSITGFKSSSLTYSNLYYLSSLGLGAIQGNDYEEYNVRGISNSFNSLEAFLSWLNP